MSVRKVVSCLCTGGGGSNAHKGDDGRLVEAVVGSDRCCPA